MARLFLTDGEVREVKPKGKTWELLELQTLVGGPIERIPHLRSVVYCNEEGLLKGLPFNVHATMHVNGLFVAKKHPYRCSLVGDVLFLD